MGIEMSSEGGHYKDAILDSIAQQANVAQFVSFDPNLRQRYSRVLDHAANHRFPSLERAAKTLLAASPEGSVNVRSFQPDHPKSREFVYGLKTAETVLATLRRLADQGLYTIANETVDVHDGGVSGVAYGNVIEFAPQDTPRCVEKPGTAAVSRRLGLRLLETVYAFSPTLPEDWELRVEFSLHPLRRGYLYGHTIIWEIERPGLPPTEPELSWPNRFSRAIGDKAFGLLVGHLVGLPVPRTHVIARLLAPFAFGVDTGQTEVWIRTCPTEQVPGRFTTRRGWIDPFRLLQTEDPTGEAIASVLAQQGVDSRFSGALIAQASGDPLVEGVSGRGDRFMVGARPPEPLPESVLQDVLVTYHRAAASLGSVRFEWVYDGRNVWVVQLHKGRSATSGRTIYPGVASRYHHFEVAEGIEGLRDLIAKVRGTDEGIVLVGRVGVTSHFGDILRRAQVPSRIQEAAG